MNKPTYMQVLLNDLPGCTEPIRPIAKALQVRFGGRKGANGVSNVVGRCSFFFFFLFPPRKVEVGNHALHG